MVISGNETEEDEIVLASPPLSPEGAPPSPKEAAPCEPTDRRDMADVPAPVQDAVARCARWIEDQLAACKLSLQGAKFSSKSAVCPLCLLTFNVSTVMVLTYLGDCSAKPTWVHHHCVLEILKGQALS